jgi:hypothetical protein
VLDDVGLRQGELHPDGQAHLGAHQRLEEAGEERLRSHLRPPVGAHGEGDELTVRVAEHVQQHVVSQRHLLAGLAVSAFGMLAAQRVVALHELLPHDGLGSRHLHRQPLE